MAEPRMAWQELVDYGATHGLLNKQLYVVFSTPTAGLGPVLASLDPHVEYQGKLEAEGVMFAAGPFASDDLQEWHGEGMFVYRAESMEEAKAYADADPMHISGARSYRIRQWLMNEGTYSVQVYYSKAKYVVT